MFELKHDGFRAVAYFENGESKLVSRNLRMMRRFESLRKSLATLPVKNAIIDGEIIYLDQNGVSQFIQLLNGKAEAVFYAFDLIWLNGSDLRQQPLVERKQQLRTLVSRSSCERLMYAQHVDGAGKQFFQVICARDLERIVAKRKLSVYEDDGTGWLKINKSQLLASGRQAGVADSRQIDQAISSASKA